MEKNTTSVASRLNKTIHSVSSSNTFGIHAINVVQQTCELEGVDLQLKPGNAMLDSSSLITVRLPSDIVVFRLDNGFCCIL
jgi:hypothetical protein